MRDQFHFVNSVEKKTKMLLTGCVDIAYVQTYMILINVNRSGKLNEKESYLERSKRTDTIQSNGTCSATAFT